MFFKNSNFYGEGPLASVCNWSSPMCDGLFLPMKDAQRQRRRKTDRQGEE